MAINIKVEGLESGIIYRAKQKNTTVPVMPVFRINKLHCEGIVMIHHAGTLRSIHTQRMTAIYYFVEN